jgi:hypothetical protein
LTVRSDDPTARRTGGQTAEALAPSQVDAEIGGARDEQVVQAFAAYGQSVAVAEHGLDGRAPADKSDAAKAEDVSARDGDSELV